jgi:sarcosine oxidase gamma subunit
MADHFRRLDELAVEVAALRLIVRSVVAQMLMLSPARMTDTLRAFEEAAAKMSPDEVPVADLDPELHKRAAALAQERARQFVRDIGKLVARKRDRSEISAPRHKSRRG